MSNKSISYKSLKVRQETDYPVSPFLALLRIRPKVFSYKGFVSRQTLSQPAVPGPGGAPRGPVGQSYWHYPPSALGSREIAPNSDRRDRASDGPPAPPPSGAARRLASPGPPVAPESGARRQTPRHRPAYGVSRPAPPGLVCTTALVQLASPTVGAGAVKYHHPASSA